MKKGIAGAVLLGLVMRLAMMAGAGEAVGGWVRELNAGGRLVSATLNIELGGGAPSPSPTEPETAAAAARSTEAPSLLLVAVTPRPEATSPAQSGEPLPTAEVLPANLSAAAALHNSTEQEVDAAALAVEGPALRLSDGEPQILIIHTHSSEAYTPEEGDRYEASDPYRTEDKAHSVIRVGDVLAEKLEAHGLLVLHDRELYDYPSYTGSYGRSGAAVADYLAAYPSIKIVLDLHRDALGDGDVIYKTHAELNGRTSAQVMLLAGTGETGLWHPNWRENLKLALYLQSAMDGKYPTLARPVELVKERYNQQLCTGMLILEAGSTGNTLREAVTAIELFADAAGPALAKLIEK